MPSQKSKIKNHKVSYDPTWIVRLAEQQIPDQKDVIENLKRTTTVLRYCDCGCGDPYFIAPDEWNFERNEVLVREDGVRIIVDIMKDKRIGSIEIGEWCKKR